MLKRYVLIALTGLAVLAVYLVLRTSEEDKVIALLEQVRALAEVRDTESGIEQLAKARDIGALFREATRFDLTNLGHGITEINDRNELVRRITSGRSRLVSLELGMQDPRVTISGDRARVEIQGQALGTIRGEQGQFLDIHRVEVTLEKTDGDWLISGGRHLQDLRQPVE
jgi:hypothetical protein